MLIRGRIVPARPLHGLKNNNQIFDRKRHAQNSQSLFLGVIPHDDRDHTPVLPHLLLSCAVVVAVAGADTGAAAGDVCVAGSVFEVTCSPSSKTEPASAVVD